MSHIIKSCKFSKDIWIWLKNTLNNSFSILVSDPEELLSMNIDYRDFKYKAALWLTVQVIVYNLEKKEGGTLDELQQKIRMVRFNNRFIFECHFKHFLNIF